MKTRIFFFIGISLGLLSVGKVFAQDNPSLLPAGQLDELFGPIALYPDALIALILPASTVPSDVVMAARYVNGNGDPTKVDAQGWDDSVTALTHYPDVVKWLDENLAWTKQAGEAFVTQPADVMNAIQRLRAKARAAGTLVDTPQQQVISEGGDISIIPAQPDVIYVPSYDPDVVYLSQPGPYDGGFLSFGVGYATGFWLGYDFDWGHRRIWTIDRRDRERYWRENRDWRHPSYPGRPGYQDDHFHQQPWRPPARSQRPSSPSANRPRPEIPRPVPYANRSQDRGPIGRPGESSPRRDDRDHNHTSSHRDTPSGNRQENAPKPATVVVPSGPTSRPGSDNPADSNNTTTPRQPAPQNPGNRNDRESRVHVNPARSPNPQDRVGSLQPVPRPAPRLPSPPQSSSTAQVRSVPRPSAPVTSPAPSSPNSWHPQHEASSQQNRPEPPQRSRPTDQDERARRDSRQ